MSVDYRYGFKVRRSNKLCATEEKQVINCIT
jgi:hypothetical protein